MEDTSIVHVHRTDEESAIEEHLSRGYILKEKTKPTIIAQGGFSRLVFVKAPEGQPLPETPAVVDTSFDPGDPRNEPPLLSVKRLKRMISFH